MGLESQVMKIKVACKDKDKPFSYIFSNIDLSADNESIYKLGTALNSMQDTKAKTFVKTVETLLSNLG